MKLSGFARERLSPEVFARLQATGADFENEGRGENIRPLKNYGRKEMYARIFGLNLMAGLMEDKRCVY